jgi:hypothetical protein
MQTVCVLAETHGLEIDITHDTYGPACPFYTSSPWVTVGFKRVETKDGPILSSDYGVGSNEEEAARDYLCQISGKLVVVDAMRPESRREIKMPVMACL